MPSSQGVQTDDAIASLAVPGVHGEHICAASAEEEVKPKPVSHFEHPGYEPSVAYPGLQIHSCCPPVCPSLLPQVPAILEVHSEIDDGSSHQP